MFKGKSIKLFTMTLILLSLLSTTVFAESTSTTQSVTELSKMYFQLDVGNYGTLEKYVTPKFSVYTMPSQLEIGNAVHKGEGLYEVILDKPVKVGDRIAIAMSSKHPQIKSIDMLEVAIENNVRYLEYTIEQFDAVEWGPDIKLIKGYVEAPIDFSVTFNDSFAVISFKSNFDDYATANQKFTLTSPKSKKVYTLTTDKEGNALLTFTPSKDGTTFNVALANTLSNKYTTFATVDIRNNTGQINILEKETPAFKSTVSMTHTLDKSSTATAAYGVYDVVFTNKTTKEKTTIKSSFILKNSTFKLSSGDYSVAATSKTANVSITPATFKISSANPTKLKASVLPKSTLTVAKTVKGKVTAVSYKVIGVKSIEKSVFTQTSKLAVIQGQTVVLKDTKTNKTYRVVIKAGANKYVIK